MFATVRAELRRRALDIRGEHRRSGVLAIYDSGRHTLGAGCTPGFVAVLLQVVGPADMILDAFASQRLIGLLSDADPWLDEDGAYGIAHEVHAVRLARGEHPVGRKIGFTNRATWPEYGVSATIWATSTTRPFTACRAARRTST